MNCSSFKQTKYVHDHTFIARNVKFYFFLSIDLMQIITDALQQTTSFKTILRKEIPQNMQFLFYKITSTLSRLYLDFTFSRKYVNIEDNLLG